MKFLLESLSEERCAQVTVDGVSLETEGAYARIACFGRSDDSYSPSGVRVFFDALLGRSADIV